MQYCPHCSEAIYTSTKICPHCKKTLEMDLLSAVYQPGKNSSPDHKAQRKVWLIEKSRIILPIVTLIIGIIIGALVMFLYDQVHFASTKTVYEEQIAELERTLDNQKSQATNAASDFESRVQQKDELISTLEDQLNILSRVMNFTNRLARNSVITVNSAEEEDYYKRNIVYLNTQFNQKTDELQEAGYEQETNFNLLVIPQLFGE